MSVEWLKWVGNVLPILLLLPLVWLVVGFTIHSIGEDEPVEEETPSLSGYLRDVAAWLMIASVWAYMLFDAWRDPKQSWFWVGTLALSVAVALFRVVISIVNARHMAAEGGSSPRT